MPRQIARQFAPHDSVLFLAFWFSRRRVLRLTDIIELYDFVNRDIPSVGELDGALNRLLAARLIAISGKGFYAPSKILRRFDAFRRRARRNRFLMAREFVESADPLTSVLRRITIRPADYKK